MNTENAVIVFLGILFMVVVFLLADLVVTYQTTRKHRKFLKENNPYRKEFWL